jgi:hypothetical protein
MMGEVAFRLHLSEITTSTRVFAISYDILVNSRVVSGIAP